MVKLTVLGCSGGIGGPAQRTTALLVDDDVLIDAGSGVGDLSLAQLATIDHVFLTHSHLDHIAFLPLLIDAVGHMRTQPVTVYALALTRAALETHVFNWHIWPDFTVLPDAARPFMRFETVVVGQSLAINGRTITVLPAHHTVPAAGYAIDSGAGTLVFTGDTTANDEFWERVNRIANLRYLLIETAFGNDEFDLAVQSKHLCPALLGTELTKLHAGADIYLTHLKPARAAVIVNEVQNDPTIASLPRQHKAPPALFNGQEFYF